MYYFYKLQILFIKCISSIFFRKKENKINFRAKFSSKIIKNYLKKYLYVINEKEINKNNEISKNVWVLWLQGLENAPDIVKLCIKSIDKYKPKGYKLHILDEKNIKEYINIPKHIVKKKEKNIISIQQYSDIIRVMLLEKYGGIWCDATIILTDNIQKEILEADFFAFHSNIRGRHNESWFLVAKKNNIFMKSMSKFFYEYWKKENKIMNYFLYHYFIDTMVENNSYMKNMWNKVPIYWDYNCYKNLFGEYTTEIYNDFKKSPIHKLNHKLILKNQIGQDSLAKRILKETNLYEL